MPTRIFSWNCGTEGPTGDEHIAAMRERQKRNFFATLLLSQGVPMLVAGDELGRTQLGNNNAYCQDNEIGWLDRGNLLDRSGDLFEFVRTLIDIRRRHPVFRRPRFFRGVTTGDSPLKDITWFASDGREMTPDDWNDSSRRCFGALLGGDTGDRFISLQGYRELDDSFFTIVNGHDAPVEFTLPSTPEAPQWIELFDTARWAGSPSNAEFAPGTPFHVADRSLVLFVGGGTTNA